jgi:glutamate-1-semialdehyde 2,1-aminomutase
MVLSAARGIAGQVTTIQKQLETARTDYVEANPRSRAHFEAACASMPGGNTRTVLFYEPFPLRIAGGTGCHLRDVDGHDYVDLLGDFTAGLFGHSNPSIAAAVTQAMSDGMALSGHNLLEERLAAGLCRRFPSIDLIRFTNSGTEANILALATAVAITGRRRVLVFSGSYHGSVLSFKDGGAPTNLPHDWVVGTYNDTEQANALFDTHGSSLAAVLVEPMLGSGGCVPADRQFLELLRRRSEGTGALLIFDEVMTSRLAPGGMQGELGIHADLTTLGKYLGGGLSFGAFGGRAEIMDVYDPRRPDALVHAGTFNNNVLSMSAGIAALELFTPESVRLLTRLGEQLRSRLNDLCRSAAVPMVFTGLGSMLTVHFTDRPVRSGADVAAADQDLKELFFFDMLAAGFYLARRGMVALSLAIGQDECDAFVHEVTSFLRRRRALLSPGLP